MNSSGPSTGTAQTPSTPPITTKTRHIAPKVGKNVIGCSALFVVATLIGICVLLILIAKTGLIQIPAFSSLYHGPTPTRLVSAEPITPNAFKVLLGSRFFSQATAQLPPPYTVSVTEKELTGAVMNAIDVALRDGRWKQVYTQLVIRPTDLELLSQFERDALRIDLLVRFRPVVADGGVKFDPVFVQIGDYRLPAAAAYRAVSYVFARDLGTWIVKFGDATLQSLALHEGVMDVTATVPLSGEKQ